MNPAVLLDFGSSFDIVVVLILLFLLYNMFSKLTSSAFLSLLLTVIVLFLLVIPYAWFRYFLFAVLFLAGIFTNVKPWEW